MVLFNDDVKPEQLTKLRKRLRVARNISLIFLVMFAISLWVLSLIGGDSKSLQLGMQDYLTETSGYVADIGSFGGITFFPRVSLDMGMINFHVPVRPDANEILNAAKNSIEKGNSEDGGQDNFGVFPDPLIGKGRQVASVDSVKVSLSFWDLFFSRNRYEGMEIIGIRAEPDVFTPKFIRIEYIKIDRSDAGKSPRLAMKGVYGGKDVFINAGLQSEKLAGGGEKIFFGEVIPLTAAYGDLSLEGEAFAERGKIDIKLSRGKVDNRIFSGTIMLRKAGRFGFDLGFGDSTAKASLRVDDKSLTGDVSFPTLALEDTGYIYAAIRTINDFFGQEDDQGRLSLPLPDVSLRLATNELTWNGQSLGKAGADMRILHGHLDVKSLTGVIAGGALTGAIGLKAPQQGEATLAAALKLENADFGALHKAYNGPGVVEGRADVVLDVAGKGKSYKELMASLEGQASVLGSAGNLSGGEIRLWDRISVKGASSGGVYECLYGLADVKGGRAQAERIIFANAGNVFRGKASVDLGTLKTSLSLSPGKEEDKRIAPVGGIALKPGHPCAALLDEQPLAP